MPTGRARRYLTDAAGALDRAPVEMAVLVAVVLAYSYMVQTDLDPRRWMEMGIAGLLVMSVAWTGTLLHELGAWTARRRWLVTAVGAGVVGLYAWLVLDLERGAEGWRAFMLLGAAALWVVAVPALAGPPGGRVLDGATDRVRAVAARVLLRSLGAALYSVALFAGLALALAAIDTLFELSMDERIYAHVAGWIFMLVGPWIVIGGLREYAAPVEPRGEVAGVAHRMLAFLVPPLLVLYYVILYAYTVRIGVTGEVPKNLVSPMVIAAGVLAALALFLFDPRPGETGPGRVLRAAPPLFLPLAALGIYTVSLRVGQYGWTEFRLLRLIVLVGFGALAVAGTVQLLRRQRFALHAAPLGAAALLVLTAIGPWAVPALARQSQQARIDAALVQAGIDPATPLAPSAGEPRTVSHELYQDIHSTGRYLAVSHGVDALPPALASLVTSRDDAYNLAALAGLNAGPSADDLSPDVDRFMAASLARGTEVEFESGTAVRIGYVSGPGPGGAGAAAVEPGTTLLVIRVAGERLTADFGGLAPMIPGRPARGRAELPPDHARIPVHDRDGVPRGTLLVLEIGVRTVGGVLELQRLDALLLLLEP